MTRIYANTLVDGDGWNFKPVEYKPSAESNHSMVGLHKVIRADSRYSRAEKTRASPDAGARPTVAAVWESGTPSCKA